MLDQISTRSSQFSSLVSSGSRAVRSLHTTLAEEAEHGRATETGDRSCCYPSLLDHDLRSFLATLRSWILHELAGSSVYSFSCNVDTFPLIELILFRAHTACSNGCTCKIPSWYISDRLELEDQFITCRFHGVSIDGLDVVIVDNRGAEVGVNRSHGQFHFCQAVISIVQWLEFLNSYLAVQDCFPRTYVLHSQTPRTTAVSLPNQPASFQLPANASAARFLALGILPDCGAVNTLAHSL